MRVPVSSAVIGVLLLASLATAGADDEGREAAAREKILRRAQVWIDPSVPIERASLDANPAAPTYANVERLEWP